MVAAKEFKGRTGPRKKIRKAEQFTITMDPELHDRLLGYMENNHLENRSGTISMLIRMGLGLPYSRDEYTLGDGEAG